MIKNKFSEVTQELIAFRDEFGLTRITIARLTGASIHSVHSWFNPESSTNSRDIPENLFRLLKFEVSAPFSNIKRGQ